MFTEGQRGSILAANGKDVAAYVAKGDVCNSQPAEQGKEPLICHELLTRPWEKIAVDLFDLNGTEFMMTVDSIQVFLKLTA